MGTLNEPGRSDADGATGGIGQGRDWDVQAAFARVGGRNVEGLKERLRELAQAYKEEEDQHLSFDEVQALVGPSGSHELSPERSAHLKGCRFCRELIDTVVGSEAERSLFLEIVRRHERKPDSERESPGRESLPKHTSTAKAWRWSIEVVTIAAVAFVLLAIRPPTFKERIDLPSSAGVSNASVNWTQATNSCKAKSGGLPSCDLLTAAAKLTTEGQNHLARPVLVSALRQAGVKDAALTKVNDTLAALPKVAKLEWVPPSPSFGVAVQASPDELLMSAKREFAAGRSVEGYENLASYVTKVSDRPAVGRALQVGFIEPVRQAASHTSHSVGPLK